MVNYLKSEGFWVRGVDLKYPEFSNTKADDFICGDLRDSLVCRDVIDQKFDEIYQFAADMGGAGYVYAGHNDASIMHNSALINLNVLDACLRRNSRKIFFSSSACIYPESNQLDPYNPNCQESSAYPANPDSEYGWEKVFSERLYMTYAKNYGFESRIARYHNIFGPYGVWEGGREKAPSALCRKIALAKDGDSIEVWGDGEQSRSFLFIDECIEGSVRLMRSNCRIPINIGSDELVTINKLVNIISEIAGKKITKKYIKGPQGVRGRNSENSLIKKQLNWAPEKSLQSGLEKTYAWVLSEINKN